MEMKVIQASSGKLKPKPADESSLGFGDIFSDHMFIMDYSSEKGWFAPRIEPYGPFSLDPAAMSLHYAQEIFEGLKAYRGKEGGVYIFRAKDNFERLNRSAKRMCMPEVDVDIVMEGMKKLLLLDEEWIPRGHGTSLYIRPAMFATEPHLGVRPSNTYIFFIIVGRWALITKKALTLSKSTWKIFM